MAKQNKRAPHTQRGMSGTLEGNNVEGTTCSLSVYHKED